MAGGNKKMPAGTPKLQTLLHWHFTVTLLLSVFSLHNGGKWFCGSQTMFPKS